MTVWSVIIAEYGQHAFDRDSREILIRHKNHGLSLIKRRLPDLYCPIKIQILVARISLPGYPPFPAIQHILSTAIFSSSYSGLNVRRIGRSNIRFCHRKARTNLSRQQRPQPVFLLLLCAVPHKDFHVAQCPELNS